MAGNTNTSINRPITFEYIQWTFTSKTFLILNGSLKRKEFAYKKKNISEHRKIPSKWIIKQIKQVDLEVLMLK